MDCRVARSAPRNDGFTLVEMAIVLVIIGLIVGGVTIGKEMIVNSQRSALIAEWDKLDSAVNTFKLKYNCLPGDCATATNFGFSTNGNGDGQVTSNSTYFGLWAGNGLETCGIFLHLSQAKLIKQTFTSCPNGTTTAVGLPSLPNFNQNSQYYISKISSQPGHWLCTTGIYNGVAQTNVNAYETLTSGTAHPFTVADVYNIDTKIDDGNAMTGSVTLMRTHFTGLCSTVRTSPADGCYSATSSNYYKFSETRRGCHLRRRTSF